MAKKREEFDNKYKWQTSALYKNDEEALKDLKWLEEEIPKLSKYHNHILDSADSLLEVLELDNNISKVMERLFVYSHINNDVDVTNVSYQELFGKVQNIYTLYLTTTAYIVPELLKAPENIITKYLKENTKLKVYERSLKQIRRQKEHVLAPKVEEALSHFASIMDAPEEIFSALCDGDFKFDKIKVDGKEVELTESNYSIYIRHQDREVRKQAFLSLYKTYANFKNTIATILRKEVERNVASQKLRHYNSSLEASLSHNEIDKKVYLNLIEVVHQNLKPLYKYWNLKKKLLNLDEFHLYDTYAETTKEEAKSYSYEEAKSLALESIKPLGETYYNDFSKAFTEGWVDSCNNEGKRGGAYCTACYSAHPYVLMSYEGTLNDVSTLIHELGHALHYYYAIQNQNFQDYNYSIFVAEVASQVNEILLSRYLLQHSNSKEEKLKIIDDLLQKYKSTIFRQTMFAEFELFMHEFTEKGNVLTYQNMCDKYLELNKLYFGENVCVDEEIKYEWERIPHFYMNFYVYQYATGFAAAIYLANRIYENDWETRDKYLEFLKLGSTKNPIDSLKVAGVDMTNDKVLEEAIKYMETLINEYEEIQGSEK